MAERPVDGKLPTVILATVDLPAEGERVDKKPDCGEPDCCEPDRSKSESNEQPDVWATDVRTGGGSVLDSNVSASSVLKMEPVLVVDGTLAGDGVSTVDIVSLVTEHHAALYRYAYRLTGSMHEAEDLSQQTFLTAQQKLGQLRGSDRALGWLFAILRTCYLKSIRKRRPFTEGSIDFDLAEVPDESLGEEPGDAGLDLEGTIIDGERLQAALNELPDEFRLVLVMFYFEELSYREIAARLELPTGTVMSRLSRAKGHLRLRLTGREYHAAKSR
jgi:RNA polymerase sigma-70 factor (ECF subfamily)